MTVEARGQTHRDRQLAPSCQQCLAVPAPTAPSSFAMPCCSSSPESSPACTKCSTSSARAGRSRTSPSSEKALMRACRTSAPISAPLGRDYRYHGSKAFKRPASYQVPISVIAARGKISKPAVAIQFMLLARETTRSREWPDTKSSQRAPERNLPRHVLLTCPVARLLCSGTNSIPRFVSTSCIHSRQAKPDTRTHSYQR